jgi:cytoskeleton protein RodZ
MAASFGEQLRLAREARGISLREISEQTRISMRYLEAIEANDFKRLPGGIFNRSFIRAYAKYIGFDEKEAVESYARTMREQGEAPDEQPSISHRPQVYTDGGSTRSPLVTLLLTILILSILSLGVYAVLHWYQRREAAPAASPGAPPSAESPRTGTPPAGTSPATSTNNAAATSSSPQTNATGFNVQIKAAGELVWMRVYTDDDQKKSAFAGNLQADEVKEFTPERSIRVQCAKDKPGSLQITINGRQVKVPFNMKGSLAEMTVSREDYEQFLQ